jgi:hypothetical protein
MLVTFTRSSPTGESPALAINRLLGLLETVVDHQARLIEEIIGPEAESQKALPGLASGRQ